MPKPKLISPLLDNYVMGEPISARNGICCCPAMNQQTEEKFIVKIISIPASQTQLDALLLTGAYPDAESANTYFRELADSTLKEADILRQLSNLGGFDTFTDCQIEPMDDGTGFDVYLLAPYKRSWERYSQLHTVTQLQVHNLALDMCAALSACRRAGHIYVDLKPENIFLDTSNGYRIGDLGFLSLDFLKYSSLPQKYIGSYTAPEITDAFSSLNNTLDVYALGMILYKAFNGGNLPFDGGRAESVEYPAPIFATEDMAQIILKAIHPDPAQRWQDPTAMGQAIVSCMQRNGVSDEPVVPPVVELDAAVNEEETIDSVESEETAPLIDDSAEAAEVSEEENVEITLPAAETESIEAYESEDVPDIAQIVYEDFSEIMEQADLLIGETDDIAEELIEGSVPADTEPLDEMPDDEVPPEDENAEFEVPDTHVSDDMPDEEMSVEDNASVPGDTEEDDCIEETVAPTIAEIVSEEADPEAPAVKKKKRPWIWITCSIIIILALAVGGYFYYKNVYIQEINALQVTGVKDSVCVVVDTDVPYDKLSVSFEDASGNVVQVPLINHAASVTGLRADTEYTITVNISGLHKLVGQTQCTYKTQQKTKVDNLTVLTGTEDGTAVVSFDVTGKNCSRWFVTFQAEGEEEQIFIFSGTQTAINGLTLGTEYTVTLSTQEDVFLEGLCETTFTPAPVMQALSPNIASCIDGKLSVMWDSPEASTNTNWIVRCFNDSGYEQTVTTSENKAVFDGLDDRKAYTVEIVAEGQSLLATANIGENAINITGLSADTSTSGLVALTWSATHDVPEEGWLVSCRVAGTDTFTTKQATENSAVLTDLAPGTQYVVTIARNDGLAVACEPIVVTTPDADSFSGYGVTASNMIFNMCLRPNDNNWSRDDLDEDDYTSTFSADEEAGFVIRLNHTYNTSSDIIHALFVFRDVENNIVCTCSSSSKWVSMWYRGYCELDVPSLPSGAGEYQLSVYFNGASVYTGDVTIQD